MNNNSFMKYKSKKRLLFVENGIDYGGAVISLKNLISHIDRTQFEIFVTTSIDNEKYRYFNKISKWYYINKGTFDIRKASDKFRRLKGRNFFLKMLSALDYFINVFPYTYRIIKLIRNYDIDLVILNNEPLTNKGGILACKISGVPCISHVRGSVLDSRTTRFLIRYVTFFFPNSNFVKSQLKDLGVPNEKMCILYPGLNHKKIVSDSEGGSIRDELGIDSESLLIGVIGVLTPWKGQDTVIRSMREILLQFPSCKLLIIGKTISGSERYKENLENIILSNGISDSVIFVGHRKDVYRFMSELDLLIHSSKLPEPFGRVIIEGMALGKPVIATAMGGPLEIIRNYETGILVPPNDPKRLSKEACHLLRNRQLRGNIGMRAREEVSDKYSAEKGAKLAERVYRKILNRGKML